MTERQTKTLGQCCRPQSNSKIILKLAIIEKKIKNNFNQHTANTLLFLMRYNSLLNSEKQLSDVQRGWVTSCFHLTLVLLFSLLFAWVALVSNIPPLLLQLSFLWLKMPKLKEFELHHCSMPWIYCANQNFSKHSLNNQEKTKWAL